MAQAALGVGVLAGPSVFRGEPVRVQVMADQVRAGPLGVHRAGGEPFGDLFQLDGQPGLRHRLPEPALPVLGERRPPRLPLSLRRIHRDPLTRLHHQTTRITH